MTYRHDGSETTTGGFSYTVSDGASLTTAEVRVHVMPVNDPPLAAPDTVEVHEGDAVTIQTASLLRNDTDSENDELTVVGVSDPLNGSVKLEGATVTYRHDGSEATTGGFSYTVSDGTNTVAVDVAVNVTPVNDLPFATPDAFEVDEGDAITLETVRLVRNDTDADSELSIMEVGGAVNGTVRLEDATVTYRHDGSETTTGGFTYVVSDGAGTATAQVTVNVMPVNDPPIASPDTLQVDEGDAVTLETTRLLHNDTDAEDDALVVTGVSDAVGGSLMLEGVTVTYQHDGSETATGGFYYTVSDGTDTATAWVTVDVRPSTNFPTVLVIGLLAGCGILAMVVLIAIRWRRYPTALER